MTVTNMGVEDASIQARPDSETAELRQNIRALDEMPKIFEEPAQTRGHIVFVIRPIGEHIFRFPLT
jgi:hypothetical protein